MKQIGCQIEISNSADLKWGSVVDGRPTGVFKDVVEGKAHLALAMIGYQRSLVSNAPQGSQ